MAYRPFKPVTRVGDGAAGPSFWRVGHLPTLLAAFLHAETGFLAWVLLGPLALFIAADLKVEVSSVGLLVALPILAGTALHLPIGTLADRFGPRRVGIATHLLVLAALAWLWSLKVTSMATLYPLALLLGVAGAAFAVAIPLASGWYPPEHQGKALGLTATGASGAMLSALLAPPLAAAYGWQTVAGLAMLPVTISLGVFLALAKESPGRLPPHPFGHYLYALRHGDTLWFCFFYAVTFGGVVSLASSLVVYFHDRFALVPAEAGTLTAICLLAAALCRPAGGWAADRFGGIRSLKSILAAVTLALAVLAGAPQADLPVAIMAIATAMAALGAGNGAVFQLIPIRFFRQMGVVTGLVGTAGGLGGFLFTYGFGLLREWNGDYRSGFALYAALALVALFGLWSVKRRWRTTWGAPHVTSARV